MDSLSYKTVSANKATAKKGWILVDAENEVLGRLASRVAIILRGKHKTDYTPHVDTGDNVIVINASKIKLTGKKVDEKEYIRHTGYPGGQRFTTPKELFAKHPERVVEYAINGMIPHNKLGDAVRKNIFVYAGSEHPHEAQQPKLIKLSTIK